MWWGRSPTGKAGSPVSAPPTGPPFMTTGSFSTKHRFTKGCDENRPIARTPSNPSPPEPGARSTAVLLDGWNEITEVSGVQHDAARGQLTIASDAPFAHHDRTGSLTRECSLSWAVLTTTAAPETRLVLLAVMP